MRRTALPPNTMPVVPGGDYEWVYYEWVYYGRVHY